MGVSGEPDAAASSPQVITVWALEPVWTFWRREKSHIPAGDHTTIS